MKSKSVSDAHLTSECICLDSFICDDVIPLPITRTVGIKGPILKCKQLYVYGLKTQNRLYQQLSSLYNCYQYSLGDHPWSSSYSRFQFQCYYAHFQSIYLVHLIGHHFFFSNLKNFSPCYAPKQLKKGAMVELKVLKAYKGFCGLCIDSNKSPLSYLVTKKVSYKIQCVSPFSEL